MERLQDNLADLRKRTKTGKFSMATTLKLGIQMIDALEGTHKLGYIHRDVKPSNYVSGRTKNTKGRIFLIDFGLARKYRLPSGEIRPPRKTAGFRGTARYASINSHKSKELSRRDDLWSVFYVLVEFALGSLPWRKIKDKDRIGELKEKYTNKELVKDLPKEFYQFMEMLQKLGYADEPDYDGLRGLLLQVYSRENYPSDLPFDWEQKETKVVQNLQIQTLVDEKEVKKDEKIIELYKEEKKRDDSRSGEGSSKKNDGTKEEGSQLEKKEANTKCCTIM